MREIVHIATGILVMGSQRVNKSVKISDQTNADFFQLNISREYFLWAVNVLTNSVKIRDQTNADFFHLNISQMHGKLG